MQGNHSFLWMYGKVRIRSLMYCRKGNFAIYLSIDLVPELTGLGPCHLELVKLLKVYVHMKMRVETGGEH